MYLVQDNHEGIISRDKFNQAKAEFARRNAGRTPSQKLAPTGRSCYSAKYALTERLVCGKCGTLYRRCVWVKRGQKFAVWRCASRIDYGTKYCRDSPTIYEQPLQAAILAAINIVMSQQEVLVGQIEDAMRMELSNVYLRLKSYFREGVSYLFSSIYGEYTDVSVRIPFQEDINHVHVIDC